MGVGLLCGRNQLLYLGGDEAFLAIAAVVGHDVEVVAYGAHGFFEEKEVAIAGTDDDIDGDAFVVSPFHLRIDGRYAYAAGHEQEAHLLLLFGRCGNKLAGTAKGADDGVEAVALVHLAETTSAFAYHLVYDADAFVLGVDVADGQGHPLAFVDRDDDDKLSGLAATGNPRCLDFHQVNLVAVEELFLQNRIHVKKV